MPTIFLIQPPIQDLYLTEKRTLPYGLASIAAELIKNGFSVILFDALTNNKKKVIDFPDDFHYLKPLYGRKDVSFFSLFNEFKHFGYSYEHIARKAKEADPFLIGISSLFSAYSDAAIQCAETIKKILPNHPIVFGGHHPTQMPESVMENKAVDFLLRGEGETSLPMLANALLNKTTLENIPGIVFRRPDNSLHINNPAWVETLDDCALPAMHLVSRQFYRRKKRAATIVVASRGCPMQCSYCSVSATASYPAFRQKSVDRIIEEIETQLQSNDIGFIDFEDENLTLNKTWFMNLLNEFNDRFSHCDFELRAMNGLYPPSLDEEMIQAMKQTGFKTLNLSLGSTSRSQLERFKRRDVRASLKQAILLSKKYDMDTVTYVIAAAPGQDPYQSVEDLIYLSKVDTLVGMSIFYPSPGSLDYNLCLEKKLLPPAFSLMRSTAFPVSDTTSRKQAITLLRLTRILNFRKSLKDEGESIPLPEPCRQTVLSNLSNRKEISMKLLSWFLYDGLIRGAGPDGMIFEHACDTELCRYFIRALTNIDKSY